MSTLLNEHGYTQKLQYYDWPLNLPPVNVNVWLWGGGGGGGGAGTADSVTSRYGGNGSGGSLSYNEISLNPGDRIGVAVGRAGRGAYGGGIDPGTGLIGAIRGRGGYGLEHTVLTSLGLHNSNPTSYVRVSLDGRWTNFLNTEGIWINPYQNPWEPEFTVQIPYTGWYTFQWSVDDTIIWRVDGQDINTESGGFRNTYVTAVLITQGTHYIGWRARNARGPYGLAFKIYMSFTGGDGSNAGVPPAGAGGGGGGATVLFKNNEVIAVAAGGAGGGGRGKNDYIVAPQAINAPNGAAGQSGIRAYAGGDGQLQGTSGAGAGGGGAGLRGGNGGPINSGDTDAQAGMNGQIGGTNFGGASFGVLPGRNPSFATISDKYYNAWRGRGGDGARGKGFAQSGTNGIAYLEFQVNSTNIKYLDTWYPLKGFYVKHNNTWRAPDTWIKQSGSWQWIVNPRWQPIFTTQDNTFGESYSRGYGWIEVQPTNPGPF